MPADDRARAVAAKTHTSQRCAFCGGTASYIYHMGDYPIGQCESCKTGFVLTMPDEETLRALYDGFLSGLNADLVPRFCEIAADLYPQLNLQAGQDLKMLDIGGGGGFFCKAFEVLGYGPGTYVDLDPQSCRFAREELGLRTVFHCDAMELKRHTRDKFDFIYCRHLIEHLVEPTAFLEKVLGLLTDSGIFVVQFPNGDSLEYLAYTNLNINYRKDKIAQSSGLSRWKVLRIMLTGGILHGMDPPRHLWAISREGIRTWAAQNGIPHEVFARHLGDAAFSPGYSKKNTLAGKLRDFAGQKILGPIHGGTHLVAVLRKPQDHSDDERLAGRVNSSPPRQQRT